MLLLLSLALARDDRHWPLSDEVISAVGHGDVAAVQAWLDAGGRASAFIDSPTAADRAGTTKGSTLLMLAAANNHERVVDVLLEQGAEIDQDSSGGFTALMSAAFHNHVRIVERLLRHGAEVDRETRNSPRNTAMVLAASIGHEYVVESLLQHGAEVDRQNADGYSALMFAAYFGHERVVIVLLAHGAEINQIGRHGGTPLTLAAQNGHSSAATALMQLGADVSVRNGQGYTALQVAKDMGHTACVTAIEINSSSRAFLYSLLVLLVTRDANGTVFFFFLIGCLMMFQLARICYTNSTERNKPADEGTRRRRAASRRRAAETIAAGEAEKTHLNNSRKVRNRKGKGKTRYDAQVQQQPLQSHMSEVEQSPAVATRGEAEEVGRDLTAGVPAEDEEGGVDSASQLLESDLGGSLSDGLSAVGAMDAPGGAHNPAAVSLADARFDTGRRMVPESTMGGETTCIVCFTNPKTHLAVPCSHQCACRACSARMERCPYCRAQVERWLEVRMV